MTNESQPDSGFRCEVCGETAWFAHSFGPLDETLYRCDKHRLPPGYTTWSLPWKAPKEVYHGV